MKISLVTVGPQTEPVTIPEAKAQLRINPSDTSYDAEISRFITTSRTWIERRYGISLITQSRQQRQDNFYETYDRYPLDGIQSQRYYTRFPVRILNGPVQSITSVKYTDTNSVLQTLVPGTDYATAGLMAPVVGAQDIAIASIYPVNSWPTFKWIPESVQINYVAGFGDDQTYCPSPIRDSIIRLVTYFFENRMDEFVGTNRDSLVQMEMNVDTLMSSYQVFDHVNLYA
jgi:uncharacterized phiE125 gp8 family phage protein